MGPLLDREVSFNALVCCRRAFVPQPERDDADVCGGIMASLELFNASDQEQGQADSAIAVGQLFITGNCA